MTRDRQAEPSAADRDAEDDHLHMTVAEATQAGWAGVVWVGEPRSGKTHILESAVQQLIAQADDYVVRVPSSVAARWHDQPGAVIETILIRLGAVVPLADVSARTAALTDALAARLTELTDERVLIVVDDLERADDVSLAVLSGLGVRCSQPVVVLATASTGSASSAALQHLKAVRIAPLGERDALTMLRSTLQLPVAPHVVRRLVTHTRGNAGDALELAQLLDAEQLAGERALDDPLPVTDATVAVHADHLAQLDAAERFALLVASVSVSDRTDTLLQAAGIEMIQVVRGPLAQFLHLVAGRFAIKDPRVRSLVHGTATLAERTEAHARLNEALQSADDRALATWHGSLATLEGDEHHCGALIDLAWGALASGRTRWAHYVAREAASQATGIMLRRAQLAAGVAALMSGWVRDAADWLRSVVVDSAQRTAAHALMPYAVAATLADGDVPDGELDALAHEIERAGAAQGSDRRWAAQQTAAVVAALHCERGCRDGARSSLSLASAGAAHSDRGGDSVVFGVVWCGLYDAAAARDVSWPPSPYLRGLAAVGTALTQAITGDLPEAMRALPRLTGTVVTPLEQAHGATEPMPSEILNAHTAVARGLLLVAAGRHAEAIAELTEAAFSTPFVTAFAGLGVLVLRRAEALVHGELGSVSEALDDLLARSRSPHVRREEHVDNALVAMLSGEPAVALSCLRLASENPAPPQSLFSLLPGLDIASVLLESGQPEAAADALRYLGDDGPAQGAAERLRIELALAGPEQVPELRQRAQQLCPTLDSLTERALTELALARALSAVSDPAARAHFATASELFLESGATALARHARHEGDGEPSDEQQLEPEWLEALTAREGEVASLVVRGLSNNDVAAELHLSVRTVEVHLGRVFKKLAVRSRSELTFVAHADPEASGGA